MPYLQELGVSHLRALANAERTWKLAEKAQALDRRKQERESA